MTSHRRRRQCPRVLRWAWWAWTAFSFLLLALLAADGAAATLGLWHG